MPRFDVIMYNDLYMLASMVNEHDYKYLKSTLKTARIGVFRALDVATTHAARAVVGLSCKECIYRDVCAHKPSLRQLLIGAGVVDMSSLRKEESFISDI